MNRVATAHLRRPHGRLMPLLVGLSLLIAMVSGSAQTTNRYTVGLRAGASSSDYSHPFVQTEVFAIRSLPWNWNLGSDWLIKSRAEVTAGALHGHGETGFVGTVGPELVIKYDPFPIALEVGVRATVLSQYEYVQRSFGLPFQFTSHVGLEWQFTSRWQLGYRFQHMSNAGLGTPNPGLNLHLLSLAYQF